MASKPLIQQLAERAGIDVTVHVDFDAIRKLFFELCAYLDERDMRFARSFPSGDGMRVNAPPADSAPTCGECQRRMVKVSGVWKCLVHSDALRQVEAQIADEPPVALEEAPGFASCGHGYAPDSPNCVQCHPTEENVLYLVNQHAALREDLREANGELAAMTAKADEYYRDRDALKALVAELEAERERGVNRKRQDQREASLLDDITQLQADLAACRAELDRVRSLSFNSESERVVELRVCHCGTEHPSGGTPGKNGRCDLCGGTLPEPRVIQAGDWAITRSTRTPIEVQRVLPAEISYMCMTYNGYALSYDAREFEVCASREEAMRLAGFEPVAETETPQGPIAPK